MDTGSDGRISVTLAKVVEGFGLEVVREYGDLEAIHLSTPDINRPGLQMAGFFDYFGADRIQIVGKSELEYICRFPARTRSKRLGRFCASGIPCILLTRSLPLIEEMDRAAERHGIPIFRTTEDTSVFLGMIITWLNVQLAPRISTHGCFIEVYGEGILILGESGVGKSETVLELVKRGHRLVADDVVEIRKVSNQTLIGTAPDVIRHFIEIRGLGIIDVKNLFGMG
ncbi:MAG: HPr(Ser) kinase/phosphatase, partial [Oscillospiraceae bacterium]|nr:HPr(Ser) kinase/phosphatase [Oscillospiraceae bacterium]